VRFTVTGLNRSDLDTVFDVCLEQGVRRLCVYHLAYAGRPRAIIVDMKVWKLLMAAALAVAAGGCGDGGGDAGASPDPAAARGVSPYLATAADTRWPDDPAAEAEDGRQLYLATCAACHGAGGQGLPNQGPDLRGSTFVAESSDDALGAFLAAGRPVGDPKNKSGLPMPPRGGNPSLSDRHLGLIVKYVRTIKPQHNAEALGSAGEQGDPKGRL
jgi:disulfide bond formation protein DsbB